MKSLAASVGDDTTAWFCHHLESNLRHPPDLPDAAARLIEALKGQSDTLRRLIEEPEAAFGRLRSLSTMVADGGADPVSGQTAAPSGAVRRLPEELAFGESAEPRKLPSQPGGATLERVFVRCERAAKRFAESEGKFVRVEIRGGDLAIDDELGERLIEPLLQIVKNALTHGIELPELRRRKGKPVEGILRLSAERHENRVCLLVEDDGAGVDLELVRRRAVEGGLWSESEAQRLDESELLGLLFVPGLSTRAQPNLLSGRGMGLDLSQDIVRRLGGVIRFSARPTAGVRVVVELPQGS
jgi:signal transduction histidine kinase